MRPASSRRGSKPSRECRSDPKSRQIRRISCGRSSALDRSGPGASTIRTPIRICRSRAPSFCTGHRSGSGRPQRAIGAPRRHLPGVRRQHLLTTGGPVDGTIAVVGLGAPADPSRHSSGDPLRGPPREHEPAAASRSAVHPPPIVPASTDNHATFAHVSSVPVQGTPSRGEAGDGAPRQNCRSRAPAFCTSDLGVGLPRLRGHGLLCG
jgi:hypothetical protein